MKFIETKRLILRNYQESDILELAKINQDKQVMEFFSKTYDLAETQDFIVMQNEQMQEKKFGFFALEEKSSKEFIGFVGLNSLSEVNFEAHFTPAIEIGWRIKQSKWNQGFATEAALACLKYGFEEIGLKEIVSFTAKINKKSQRIMEKINMKYSEKEDFFHPKLSKNHELALHVLYQVSFINTNLD